MSTTERIARRRQTREAYYAEQDAIAAAREAVVKAAMTWWRIFRDPDEPAAEERLANVSLRACCEDLSKLEGRP